MVTQTLASTIVTGLIVAVVLLAAGRYVSAPERPDADRSLSDRVSASLDSPAVLGGVFALLAVLIALATVASVGAFGVSDALASRVVGGVVALIGVVLAAFLFLGPYALTRQHGLGNAHATAAGLASIGLAFLLVVAAQLMAGS